MVLVVQRAAALGDIFMRVSPRFLAGVSFVLIVLMLGVAQAQNKEIQKKEIKDRIFHRGCQRRALADRP